MFHSCVHASDNQYETTCTSFLFSIHVFEYFSTGMNLWSMKNSQDFQIWKVSSFPGEDLSVSHEERVELGEMKQLEPLVPSPPEPSPEYSDATANALSPSLNTQHSSKIRHWQTIHSLTITQHKLAKYSLSHPRSVVTLDTLMHTLLLLPLEQWQRLFLDDTSLSIFSQLLLLIQPFAY